MHHRNFPLSLLATLAFSLLMGISIPAGAEPGVPSDNTTTTTNAAPAPTPAPPPASAPSTNAAPSQPADTVSPSDLATYTIAKGDSLWTIAHKHGCTVTQLEKLNKLKKHALLHPGQILKLPPPKTSTPATTPETTTPAPATPPPSTNAAPAQPKTTSLHSAKSKAKAIAKTKTKTSHHETDNYVHAQPVQDFDIPASTFGSCPVPLPSDTDDPTPDASNSTDTASTDSDKPAPVAQLVSPAELSADAANNSVAENTPPADSSIPETTPPSPMVSQPSESSRPADSDDSTAVSQPVSPAPAPRQPGFLSRLFNPFASSPTTDWGARFMQTAQQLAAEGIEYDESWRPPGEAHSWEMDCSNTARYLYKVTAGIILPRTASDQYYYLHLQNKAWDVPQTSDGFADCDYLRQNLKPGDLLFWENTYRPERQPPITHVMVFLGTNDKGQWIMAGSQTSRGGEHDRSNGGPDIYVFRPTQPCGGYSTWLGLVHHQGRFCAFGRPLEADRSKLAVATDD
jgi:LysM repeat protein